MVVRTNTMSTNAYRQLSTNNTQLAKSLEKLSSGFRINRAGDDASGLAISEKMKAQIKGLEQASANSQDGISLVQTAEGALTEVHSMLNRMVSLATKSASGTIQDTVDRDAIQTEVDALNTEITRIAKSTNFNGINLLDGSLGEGGQSLKASGTCAGVGIVTTETPASATKFTSATIVTNTTLATPVTGQTLTVAYTDETGAAQSTDVTFDILGADTAETNATAMAAAGNADSDLSKLFTFGTDGLGKLTITNKTAGVSKAGITSLTDDIAVKGTPVTQGAGTNVAGKDLAYTSNLAGTFAAGDKVTVNGNTFTFKSTVDGSDGKTFDDLASLKTAAELHNMDVDISIPGSTTFTSKAGAGLVLQVGDSNDSFNKVTVNVADLTAEGLGTAGLDVSSQTAAGNSISTIKAAINTVSTNRGNLGALQNRLEYAINSMDTTTENMDAANSRIRDTDMAKEMMTYTKMNILSQAAQAMLAQANQNPQSILQLLQ
ncbi:MAG: flagellin [Firmicutes bacterium HGW-Firmicutes-16]|nr:MAG: flagellin [Firmicutes bacterium HGW-Firmicutes-16]